MNKIEELKTSLHFGYGNPTFTDVHNDLVPYFKKINELVEAVNSLRSQLTEEECYLNECSSDCECRNGYRSGEKEKPKHISALCAEESCNKCITAVPFIIKPKEGTCKNCQRNIEKGEYCNNAHCEYQEGKPSEPQESKDWKRRLNGLLVNNNISLTNTGFSKIKEFIGSVREKAIFQERERVKGEIEAMLKLYEPVSGDRNEGYIKALRDILDLLETK